MDQTNDLADVREQRLELYYQRQLASLMRKDASQSAVSNALSVAEDARLPRVALKLKVDDHCDQPFRWPLAEGLGIAIEDYVVSLRQMEKVRREHSSHKEVTNAHRTAFEAVLTSARALERLGWPVNWEQNVQAILETTEYGLRDGKLVHRFEDLPECVTLEEEMLLMGSTTFYLQTAKNGKVGPFKAVPLTSLTKSRYDKVELRLRRDGDKVPLRSRYCSDWLEDNTYRIAI